MESVTQRSQILQHGSSAAPILTVTDLAIEFGPQSRPVEVVRSASFDVRRGEVVGLVGESGSGKTVSALATMGLIPTLRGRVTRGSIRFDDQDVTNLSQSEWRHLRGRRIGMVFQQPMRSLNPALTVGEQIAESVRRHLGFSRKLAWQRAVEMLTRVEIDDAARRARDYPHQFSGGMCQRVMIAMALACEPDMIIADEPTTALDVTVQATILDLLREIIRDSGVSVLYISHDLAVISQLCSRVVVMYAGEVVEHGRIPDAFVHPHHPYTAGLVASVPKPGTVDRLYGIAGQVPPPGNMPKGCRFFDRCEFAVAGTCDGDSPLELQPSGGAWSTRCVRHEEIWETMRR